MTRSKRRLLPSLRYMLTHVIERSSSSFTRVSKRACFDVVRPKSSTRVSDELPYNHNLERHSTMKIVTATLVALAGLSLCAAPLAFAQATTANAATDNSTTETKLK